MDDYGLEEWIRQVLELRSRRTLWQLYWEKEWMQIAENQAHFDFGEHDQNWRLHG